MSTSPVVYVDDEPMVCRVFEINLKMREVEVATFTSPTEAIEFINQNDVRAVFSDYRMPEMTGAELQSALERDVPFYIVTGGTGAHEDPALRAQAGSIIGKPIDYDEVIRLVRESAA
jgi:DNA-binding NtrC family response regulator